MHRIVQSVFQVCLTAPLCISIGFLTAADEPADKETSSVMHLHFDDLLDNQYDVEVVLRARNGKFHHGYALIPELNNLPHRIDLTPSHAIEFQESDGSVIDVPASMQNKYSYKKKDEFFKWKGRYTNGEIDIVATEDLPALSVRDDDMLNGVLDVLLLKVDEANSARRNNSSRAFRLTVNAQLDEAGSINEGSATVYSYNDGDWSFGADSPRRTLSVTGGWQKNPWQAQPNTEFAEGTDWPMAHGPNLSNHAAPFEGEFVTNLHDARLLWVAEDILPSGRSGGRSRGGFAMMPYSWTTIGYGGYGAPIIADNKVFVFVHTADMDAIHAHPDTATDPFVKLGVEKESLGTVLNVVRDTIYVFDAQTGQLLWDYYGKTGSLSRVSKSGMASTPCFYDGKIFVRGQHGVYALHAENGEKIWHIGGHGIHGASNEGSITQVGGSLIVVSKDRDGLSHVTALSPADGSVLWKQNRLGSAGVGIPGVYEEDGKQYLVLGRPAGKPGKRYKGEDKSPVNDTFVMLDPVDGRVLWESDALRAGPGPIMVQGNIAVGNGTPGLVDIKKKRTEHTRLAGARISTKGAEPLWVNEKVHHPSTRTMNVIGGADNQLVINDSRVSGFKAVNIATGETVGSLPHIYHMTQGSHNWTWHIAARDRVFSSGVAIYSTTNNNLKLVPGRLSLDITSGYSAPTKPAFADGRIVLRLADKLVCYDLRKQPSDATEVIALTAKNAIPSAAQAASRDLPIVIRYRDGKLISAGAKVGRQAGQEQWQFIHWAGDWTGAMPWRKTIPDDLDLTSDTLTGTVPLRLAWQQEPFEIQLERQGNKFTGTYSRIIPSLQNPVEVGDEISGKMVQLENGQIAYHLTLANGIGGLADLKQGVANRAFQAFLITDADGSLSHGWGVCGQFNTVTHEVDASGLTWENGHITGELKVIAHDDRFQDAHYDDAVAKLTKAAEGPALGIRYTIDVTVGDDTEDGGKALSGSFSGLIGAALRYDGAIS
jgi:hypothetical protein